MSDFCNARVWGGGHESCCRTKTDEDLCNAHQKAKDDGSLYLGLLSESRPTHWGTIDDSHVGLPKSLEGRRGKKIAWKNDPVEDWESTREEKKIKKTKNTKKSKKTQKKTTGNRIRDLKNEIAEMTASLMRAHEMLRLAEESAREEKKSFIDKKANQLTKAQLKMLMDEMDSDEEEKEGEGKVVGLIYNSKGEEVGNITEVVPEKKEGVAEEAVVVKKVAEMVSEIEASAPVDDGEATLAYESEQEEDVEGCENVIVDGKTYQLNHDDMTLIDAETYEEVGKWDKENEEIIYHDDGDLSEGALSEKKKAEKAKKDLTTDEIKEMIVIKEKEKKEKKKKEKEDKVKFSTVKRMGSVERDEEEEIFEYQFNSVLYQIDKEDEKDGKVTRCSDFEEVGTFNKETRMIEWFDEEDEESDEE